MGNILISGVTVLTMEEHDKIFQGGVIAIAGNRIAAAGPPGSLPAGFIADRKIDGTGMVALPGLVNCHTHAAMSLMRSYADDMPLMKWLSEKIWPLEEKLTPEDVYWGTMLSCLEMIKSGTTTFADMYFMMDRVAEAVGKSGMRACLSRGMIGDGPNAQLAADESAKLIEDWHGGAGDRIKVMLGPHAPYTCPPDYLKKVFDLAVRYNVGIHIHVAETEDEIEQIREKYGKTPVRYLDDLGLFEVPVLAAHCVHLNDQDIDIIARKKVGVAHCPESNMKLASGIAPVVTLLGAGGVVGLGTDGAASNNNLDMLEEMRTAALLQKVSSGDPLALPSFAALRMATAEGARTLGLAGDIGVLRPGMKADLILVNFRRPHLCPRHDLYAHLVYAAQSADVETVVIDGRVVMEDRRVLTMDEEEVMAGAERCARKLTGN